jgi:hypothetical protein
MQQPTFHAHTDILGDTIVVKQEGSDLAWSFRCGSGLRFELINCHPESNKHQHLHEGIVDAVKNEVARTAKIISRRQLVEAEFEAARARLAVQLMYGETIDKQVIFASSQDMEHSYHLIDDVQDLRSALHTVLIVLETLTRPSSG